MAEEKEEERKLTAAEQRRLENFEKIAQELEAQGYEKKNLTAPAWTPRKPMCLDFCMTLEGALGKGTLGMFRTGIPT